MDTKFVPRVPRYIYVVLDYLSLPGSWMFMRVSYGNACRMTSDTCATRLYAPYQISQNSHNCLSDFFYFASSNMWPHNSLDLDPMHYFMLVAVKRNTNLSSWMSNWEQKHRIKVVHLNLSKEVVYEVDIKTEFGFIEQRNLIKITEPDCEILNNKIIVYKFMTIFV